MNIETLEKLPSISIGVAARLLGISVSSIRQYESAGLILIYREPNGRRLLAPADLERLSCIKERVREQGFNFEGLRRLLALIPCWELLPCSEDDRKDCPAFKDSVKPCWSIPGNVCAQKGLDCRECKVYWDAPNCTDNMKEFLKKTPYHSNNNNR